MVIVLDVDAQNALEMAAGEDQEPIQTFSPYRPDPTLSECVGLRRVERRLDHIDAFRVEHVVEGGAELGVPVVD